jgi:hypothetical protein
MAAAKENKKTNWRALLEKRSLKFRVCYDA